MNSFLIFVQRQALLVFYVLQMLAVPAYACQDRSKISFVKGNMRTLQTAIETYSQDWNGRYPNSVTELEREATSKMYWKELVNPFTGKYGINQSLADAQLTSKRYRSHRKIIDVLGIPVEFKGDFVIELQTFKAGSNEAGCVFYSGHGTHYVIYGLDKSGGVIQEKGRDFFLSNS